LIYCKPVQIAEVEPYRAVTHNKGIMNLGIDAVVLATGNDFRAVEAEYVLTRQNQEKYSGLSHAKIEENDISLFWLEIPLALGTVGGLTSFAPLVKLSLEGRKATAQELMQCMSQWRAS
jgi:hydroxymethylglutaryl-CoA reductase